MQIANFPKGFHFAMEVPFKSDPFDSNPCPGRGLRRFQRWSPLIQKLSALISAVSVLIQRCTLAENLWTALTQLWSALENQFFGAAKSAVIFFGTALNSVDFLLHSVWHFSFHTSIFWNISQYLNVEAQDFDFQPILFKRSEK